MAKKYPKKYPPNENALPALSDPVAEAKRLASINQRKEENKQERARCRNLKKTDEQIITLTNEVKMLRQQLKAKQEIPDFEDQQIVLETKSQQQPGSDCSESPNTRLQELAKAVANASSDIKCGCPIRFGE